nr:metallophosphoesterase family protein [Nakamurella leprariae]
MVERDETVHSEQDLADTGASVAVTVLSDTHLPTRAKDLPAALWADIDRADLVVHAGDWVGADLLDLLQSRSRRLLGSPATTTVRSCTGDCQRWPARRSAGCGWR